MNSSLTVERINTDLCVIGGGLSGAFCALSAARHGAKVVLMQDRPMLGGNASSEIRMWVRGAKGKFDRESGLISELEERNIKNNPNLSSTLFDATLYDMVSENENITLVMNTSCLDATMVGNSIKSIIGWQTTTYKYVEVSAKIFADCSGDSILAPLTNAEYRHGREGKSEYGEELAPDVADSHTMGMSVILAARETDKPVHFTPPSFANVYPNDECFNDNAVKSVHAQIRDHKIHTSGGNLWWVELGGEGHSIYDADKVRHELLCAIYGVWDHIKNQGDHGMENWDIDWVGFLPGKRESRRYVGDYVMSEKDVISGGNFYDEVAYGGWPLDDHNPYGMRKNSEESSPSVMIPIKEIYGIPLRSLYSKNIENLVFAGRNISVTHCALSSTRVMATCALIGQATGSAVSLCIKYNENIRSVATSRYAEVQRILLDDGVFLPHVKRDCGKLIKNAKINISDKEKSVLLNGIERPRTDYDENNIIQKVGSSFVVNFDKSEYVDTLRIKLDADFERLSISPNLKMRVFAMKLHTGKDFEPVKVSSRLVKAFRVYADNKLVAKVENNCYSLICLPIKTTASQIEIKWDESNGFDEFRVFSVDFI